MADRDSKQDMIESKIPNIEIRQHWTQSDEFAVYVKCLQKSRQQIKYAREKFASDTDEKRTAQGILKRLYLDTCEGIAEIDALRAKTKPVRCEHSHMINNKCQVCNKTIYYEPDAEEK